MHLPILDNVCCCILQQIAEVVPQFCDPPLLATHEQQSAMLIVSD